MASAIRVAHRVPDIDSYLRLREGSGFSPRRREAAEAGLPIEAAGHAEKENS